MGEVSRILRHYKNKQPLHNKNKADKDMRMPETHESSVIINRLSQLDAEVMSSNKDISDLRSDMSGVTTGLSNLSSQVSQMVTRLNDWSNKQANSQKTNWAVFASFIGIAITLAFGVFTSAVYFSELTRKPLENSLVQLANAMEIHQSQGHIKSQVALEKLTGRVLVLEHINRVPPRPER